MKSTVLEAWEWNSPGGVKIDTKEQILESWTAAAAAKKTSTSVLKLPKKEEQQLSFFKGISGQRS